MIRWSFVALLSQLMLWSTLLTACGDDAVSSVSGSESVGTTFGTATTNDDDGPDVDVDDGPFDDSRGPDDDGPGFFCGDDFCSDDENCETCPDDCGACPECGDGICNGTEECLSCSADCGACFTGCSEALYISEYVEGGADHKAIEIANFTGISSDYERPAHPEVHLRTEDMSPEDAAAQIMAYLEERGILNS